MPTHLAVVSPRLHRVRGTSMASHRASFRVADVPHAAAPALDDVCGKATPTKDVVT